MGDAWVALAGALIGGGGALGVAWLNNRQERLSAIRAERLGLYWRFLTAAEDSVHRFELIVKGLSDPGTVPQDLRAAIELYEVEVVSTLQSLRLSAPRAVEEAATNLRRSVGAIRSDFLELTPGQWTFDTVTSDDRLCRFKTKQSPYRECRRAFIQAVRRDLGRKRLTSWDKKPGNDPTPADSGRELEAT